MNGDAYATDPGASRPLPPAFTRQPLRYPPAAADETLAAPFFPALAVEAAEVGSDALSAPPPAEEWSLDSFAYEETPGADAAAAVAFEPPPGLEAMEFEPAELSPEAPAGFEPVELEAPPAFVAPQVDRYVPESGPASSGEPAAPPEPGFEVAEARLEPPLDFGPPASELEAPAAEFEAPAPEFEAPAADFEAPLDVGPSPSDFSAPVEVDRPEAVPAEPLAFAPPEAVPAEPLAFAPPEAVPAEPLAFAPPEAVPEEPLAFAPPEAIPVEPLAFAPPETVPAEPLAFAPAFALPQAEEPTPEPPPTGEAAAEPVYAAGVEFAEPEPSDAAGQVPEHLPYEPAAAAATEAPLEPAAAVATEPGYETGGALTRARELHPAPVIEMADRLEILAHELRERGIAGMSSAFRGDALDAALAGLISGYLAGRGR